MTVSVAERAPGRGVVVADIDLHSIRQVDRPARVGTAGYAYAVDSHGELVTHPNINLVLRHTSFASPAAGSRPRFGRCERDRRHERASDATSKGRKCSARSRRSIHSAGACSSSSRSARLSLHSSRRSGVPRSCWSPSWRWPIATSVLLARRLVRPIESIQAAAAKIGSGSLNQRIEISSNDELGALAEEFNRMAARLQESYAGLEQKVEERTRELGTALAELD